MKLTNVQLQTKAVEYICCLCQKVSSRSQPNMPPKKVEEKNFPILGRLGTNLKMGILGLPNVGKSTFFNVLTKSEAQAENFPFCTIDPNEARVVVNDSRFDWLVEHYKPASRVPAYLNVTDIAGLVKGASEGQGLGNAFLSHVSACDALFHLCRAFDDDDVTHVEGEVNPTRDLDIISQELILKDLAALDGILDKLEKLAVRANDKTKKPEYECMLKVKELLEAKKFVRHYAWPEKDIEFLNNYLFLTAKPVVYLVNLSEKDYIRKKNKYLVKIKEWIDANDAGGIMIPFSGAFELKVIEMEPEQREAYLKENSVTSALDKIVKTGYGALQLEYFFTAGKDEVRAWTIQKGTKAPQAAGRIHTDFEKGFIMAEVFKCADLIELGSESAVKAAGKYRQQGKTYTFEDGDVAFFKFNAGAGLTAKKK
ncbi:Obg-like ATPase 1 [Aphelenchoides bicaudatus]|nr:Obg-like ATPase 1 [Aphelenchoides bicaudatus]